MLYHQKNSLLSDVKVSYLRQYMQGENFLDLGAGKKLYSEWIVQQKPQAEVMAVDYADFAPESSIPFRCLNLEDELPFHDNAFSSVLAFDIIEHIVNEHQLVTEIFRILKTQGVLIGSVPHGDTDILKAYNLTFHNRDDVTHKRYYTPDSVTKLFEDHGFRILCVDLRGAVSPHVFAEFFTPSLRFLVKKGISLLYRCKIINVNRFKTDVFFVAQKQ
ncbi:MAG: hypothetical protein US22_C0004G0017 [candidate division TM6 bacterium GW2011_GWF2_36_6]|nr:MAG: hypothetical protein US22_C0004G0017 [candidate division TM6 bacterium GW2011_GWF2_36_6]